jgi:hypothetical protein
MKAQEADPVIAEIREARHRISARFGHDPRRLVAYYLQKQEHHLDRPAGETTAPGVDTGLTGDRGGPTTPAAETDR